MKKTSKIRDRLPILTSIFGIGFFALLAAYANGKSGNPYWLVDLLSGTVLIFAMLILTIVWAFPVERKSLIHDGRE